MRNSRSLIPLLLLAAAVLAAPALAGERVPPRAPGAPEAPEPPEPVAPVIMIPETGHPTFWAGGFGRIYLGVGTVDLNDELCRHFGVDDAENAVMVSHVVEDSPAAAAGIEVGDILSAVNGKPVESGTELRMKIVGKEAGELVLLDRWRDGRKDVLQAELAEREGATEQAFGRYFGRRGLGAARELELAERLSPEREVEMARRAAELAQRFSEKFKDQEWLDRLRAVETERQQHLEQQIERLESRLQELEQKLGSSSGKKK